MICPKVQTRHDLIMLTLARFQPLFLSSLYLCCQSLRFDNDPFLVAIRGYRSSFAAQPVDFADAV